MDRLWLVLVVWILRSRRPRWTDTRGPRHYHGTQEDSQNRNPGLLISLLPLLSLDAARIWTCVSSPNAAGSLRHYRQEIPSRRGQGILCRPLVWTADGRPHLAVTRTLQCAADIASSRNGQQMSAKSLQHRWKHEIQIALFRRKAAITRAVLPNPSARAEWLLAGLTDRTLNQSHHCSPQASSCAHSALGAACSLFDVSWRLGA